MLTKRTLLEYLRDVDDLARIYLTLDADGKQDRPLDEVKIVPATDTRSARVFLLPAYRRKEWGEG